MSIPNEETNEQNKGIEQSSPEVKTTEIVTAPPVAVPELTKPALYKDLLTEYNKGLSNLNNQEGKA